ncbi:AraC family transcriptional regulator [Paenibacillus sp. FSL R5-0519]|uniref:helix-turn-helix domain-containing protein n=1 Tax=Paenibacillus sp. FSL R5-0519 TaxID=2921648 RepID=UPI0030DB281A
MGLSQLQRHLEEMKVNVTLAGNVRVPADWNHYKHVTANNCLYLFLEGQGKLEINHESFRPQSGEVYFLPAGSLISYSTSQTRPFRQMFCHFHAHCGHIPLFRILYPPLRIKLGEDHRAELIFSQLIEAFNSDDEWSPLAVKAAIFALFYELWSKPGARPKLIANSQQERADAIAQYMQEHIDGPLNIESVATAFGYSPKYFFRYFKSVFGTTPHQYWASLKMERAKKMLLTTDWSVEEIATELGMERSHLTRMFLQYTEMTPAKFRIWSR